MGRWGNGKSDIAWMHDCMDTIGFKIHGIEGFDTLFTCEFQ
jgi:hypothetical protein